VELRNQVERLLHAHFHGRSILDAPVQTVATVDEPLRETAGTVIGPYKLIEQVGEGGMGTVWMAQQTEPVKRLVAVKLIKAGMDSKQVLARFEAERQALALMDHPNIARVLDAGTTGAGRPYFVMDLVKGVPITKYCDEHRLTPRQRLELFIPVCQAIQHAHQKGIIHRDLKPSNVLVALYDGKPVPKVIDFGVAKAAGQSLTKKTLVTGFGAVVGTLEYMSPEQAEVNQLDVDTRSDIYSLGVLLYELLTGTTPLEPARLKKAALVEVLRLIREEEPPKPSTRLSSTEGLPSVAAQRHTEPAKLTKLVRGELDWIVMKALEKDRNRRYETANGFAMDVQRYLADEPVQACPPSAGYRLRKFARRNRSSLAVAGLVLFFLVLLGGGGGWAWRDRAARVAERANHLERAVERAELLQREGKRGEALAALERAQLLAREAEPAPPLAARIELLQQLLDAERRDEVFVEQFEGIRREVLTEVDVEQDKFRVDNAYPKLREALEHYGISVGATPSVAAVTQFQKRPPTIQTVVVAALDECIHSVPMGDPGAREWLINVLQKADSDPWRNKVRLSWTQPGALETLAKDIDVRQQPPSFLLLVVRALPTESSTRLHLARRVQFAYPRDFWANHELGIDLYRAEKYAEAIRYYTAALALRPDNAGVLLRRGRALHGAGELDAALADIQRAIALAPQYAMAQHHLRGVLEQLNEAASTSRLVVDYAAQGRSTDALRLIDELLAKADRPGGSLRRDSALIALCVQHFGRLGDLGACRAAAERLEKQNPADPVSLYNAACCRAVIAAAQAQAGGPDAARLAKEEADRAMAWLTKAVAAGFGDATGFGVGGFGDAAEQFLHADLDPLRDREDFRKLLADLEAKSPPCARARYYILLSQWDKAAAEYAKAELWARPLPDDAFGYAGLFLIRGDSEGYNRFCEGVIERVSHTEPLAPFEAYVLARGCAMAPKSPVDPARAVQWASQAVASGYYPWYFHTLGLAQYRAGQFEQALESFTKANIEAWTNREINWFGLALVHHRLGHPDDARQCLDRGVQWLKRVGPPDPNRLPNIHPLDWLLAQLLRREAEEMLKIKRNP
jgi:serine/threonine protein kinase/Flp pilus assembly protein TadD